MLRFVCGTSILIALISLVVTARAIATGVRVTGVSYLTKSGSQLRENQMTCIH